jgi:RimJ/RimL family protein N-acetyltransferase
MRPRVSLLPLENEFIVEAISPQRCDIIVALMEPVRTRRLLLRHFTPGDVDDLVRLAGAREVAANTLRIPHPYSLADAQSFVAAVGHPEPGARFIVFAITLAETGALCGSCGLDLDPAHQRAELGYWIGVHFWGHGYATEAAAAVTHCGFEQLGLHRVFSMHFVENPASGRVLQKIGMRHEGRVREHDLKWGKFHDLEMYGMVHPERPPAHCFR